MQLRAGSAMAPFALGVAAPEQVDDPLFAFGDGADDGIGEGLPAAAGVRGGLVGPHGQHGVQQQDPCSAQRSRFPLAGTGRFRSLETSWKMFCNEGGKGMPSATEKQRPLAWPSPW